MEEVLLIISYIYRPPLPLSVCLSSVSVSDSLKARRSIFLIYSRWSSSQKACRKDVKLEDLTSRAKIYRRDAPRLGVVIATFVSALFSCLFTPWYCICAYPLRMKMLMTASFLLQCVCGRWMWQCPRAVSRWPAAKQPCCPAPSPPALPSTTSTSSGWWYHCPMPTSQNRYSVHHLRTHSHTRTEHCCSKEAVLNYGSVCIFLTFEPCRPSIAAQCGSY